MEQSLSLLTQRIKRVKTDYYLHPLELKAETTFHYCSKLVWMESN